MAISRILDTTIRRNHAKQLSASFLTVRGRQGNFRRFSQAPDTLPSLQQRASHDLNEINFRYTPLRAPGGEGSSDPKAFRLVELLPGATTDPIRCRLREVDVEVTEKYEALSYCWGNPKDRSTIECNGKQLLIPSNLAAALQGLRLTASSRHLWADAVCIDQADPSDKALQVPRMRSIYSLSQRTLIWLGTMGDSNAPSISPASKMAVRLAPLLALASRRTSLKIGTVDIRTGRRGQLSPFSGAFYLAMVHILRRPWFRRAWVVQEAAVSRKATILFDHIEYDWDEIVAALKFLSRVKFPLGFLSSPQHMAAVDHERNLYAKGGGSLPGLLIRHQRCLATDQRDKIFAFAGLLNPAAAERDVRITYTDSPETVYRELATMIMARDENLDILSRPPAIGSSRLESGIPSWVPDWSVAPNPHLSYTWSLGPPSLAETEARDGLGQTCRFAASGGSRYKPEISGDTLHALGYSIGTVSYVGPIFSGVVLADEVSRLRDWARGWMRALRSIVHAHDVLVRWQNATGARDGGIYLHTGETVGDAFWETVCAGQYRSSQSVHAAVQSWERVTTRLRRIRPTGLPLVANAFEVFSAVFVFIAHMLKSDPLFEHRLQGRHVLNRRMVKLVSGHLGLANCAVEAGDHVLLVRGSNVPLVMRGTKDGKAWTFVGDAYVHGVMNGELWAEGRCRPVAIA